MIRLLAHKKAIFSDTELDDELTTLPGLQAAVKAMLHFERVVRNPSHTEADLVGAVNTTDFFASRLPEPFMLVAPGSINKWWALAEVRGA
jgi:hypothetical protein